VVQNRSGNALKLETANKANDGSSFEHVHVPSNHLAFGRKHTDVGLILLTWLERPRETHGFPAVGNVYLCLGVQFVIGIRHKPSQMTNAIDPVRCADEILSILQRLADNVSGGFEILPIENDGLHATVRVLVLHKRSEELVGHALEKSV
jgi:hypothetical protein